MGSPEHWGPGGSASEAMNLNQNQQKESNDFDGVHNKDFQSELRMSDSGERKTAEQQGQENLDAAKEALTKKYEGAKKWISVRFGGAKSIVGKAGGLMKRMGLNALGIRQGLRNVKEDAVAAALADWHQTREDYKHISDGVKGKVAETSQRIQEAYGRAVNVKEQVFEGCRARIDQICEAGRGVRESIAHKIKNMQVQAEVNRINRELADRLRKQEQDADLIKETEARMLRNNEAILKLEDLKKSILGGAEPGASSAAA